MTRDSHTNEWCTYRSSLRTCWNILAAEPHRYYLETADPSLRRVVKPHPMESVSTCFPSGVVGSERRTGAWCGLGGCRCQSLSSPPGYRPSTKSASSCTVGPRLRLSPGVACSPQKERRVLVGELARLQSSTFQAVPQESRSRGCGDRRG